MHELSAVGCLLDPPASTFAVHLFNREKKSSSELGRQIGLWGGALFARPAFFIAISGLSNDGEAIIRGMEAVLPAGTIITGGSLLMTPRLRRPPHSLMKDLLMTVQW